MSAKVVELSLDGPIATLTINRPDALNAISPQVLDELVLVTNEIKRHDFGKLRCLLVTGAGEKAFVAGADIKSIQGLKDPREAQAFSERGQNVFREFEKLNVPAIAVVQGFALGGGMELALSCDFIVASEKAKFGLPEVGLGLIPGFGGTIRLARSVGVNRARYMIFSGEMISAAQARDWGLVTQVWPDGDLLKEAKKLAGTLASRGPLALGWAKRTVLKGFDMELDQALRMEAKNFGELIAYADTREGLQAFIEKRAPNFRGS